MNTSKIIAAAALSLLAAVGAQAETYEGVQTVNTVASRSEVAADATQAARTAVFGEARYNGVAPALNGSTDRASVHNQAVQTARMGNLYGNQASAGVLSVGNGNVDRAAVRAEARNAARTAAL